jgi:MCM N-terminal domain
MSGATQKLSYYRQQIIGMKHDGINTLFVDFFHLQEFNEVLAAAICEDFYRYQLLLI